MDWKSTCRFCLGKVEGISEIETEDECLWSLNSIFNLEIYKEDSWPKRLCKCCMKTSNDTFAFYWKIKEGEKKLFDFYGEKFPILKKEVVYPEELPLDVKQEVQEEENIEDKNILEDAASRSSSWAPSLKEDQEDSDDDDVEIKEVKKNKPPKVKNKKEQQNIVKKDPKQNVSKKARIIQENNAIIERYLKLKCEICSCKSRSYMALKSHYRTVHKEKGYLTCCYKKYTDLGRLADHVRLHFNPEHYKCPKCSRVMRSKEAFKAHSDTCQVDPKDYTYVCEICSEAFPSNKTLLRHRRHHAPDEERIHKCSDCAKSFLRPCELKIHWLCTHNPQKDYICDICAKAFRSKQMVKLHIKTHFKQKTPKRKCKQCGGFYANDRSLERHLKRCQAKSVVCTICGKELANEIVLKKHIRDKHQKLGEKKTYPCEICPKTFSTGRKLKDHIGKHQGIPRQHCKFCDKQFFSYDAKTVHQRKVHPVEHEASKSTKIQ